LESRKVNVYNDKYWSYTFRKKPLAIRCFGPKIDQNVLIPVANFVNIITGFFHRKSTCRINDISYGW
jgi:hypothetical protein